MRRTTIAAITISFFFLLGMISSANAITIDATKLDPPYRLNINYWTGTQTSNPEILAAIAAYIGSAQELYKQNYNGMEEGALANHYQIIFSGTSNATITWDGPSYIGSPSYLLVKDGNHDPAWYLFDLNAVNWDGKETIELINFWLAQGGISYVAIYGTPVPEPGILILLGIAMSAVGIASHYVRKI